MAAKLSPKSGYAYWSIGRRVKSAWRSVGDESWATIMLSPAEDDFEYLGRRKIDGSDCLV